MSVEDTNTPNGVGKKDLYSQNKDENIIVASISCDVIGEKDIMNWNAAGDGIKEEETQVVAVSDAIRDNGSIKISATLVGQPMIAGPDSTTKIREDMKAVKGATFAREGTMTFEEYRRKMKIVRETKAETDRYDGDSDRDGIKDVDEKI